MGPRTSSLKPAIKEAGRLQQSLQCDITWKQQETAGMSTKNQKKRSRRTASPGVLAGTDDAAMSAQQRKARIC
jgi:hypothetical protein